MGTGKKIRFFSPPFFYWIRVKNVIGVCQHGKKVWIYLQNVDIFNLFRYKMPCSKRHVHRILHNLLFLMQNHTKVTPETPHHCPLTRDGSWSVLFWHLFVLIPRAKEWQEELVILQLLNWSGRAGINLGFALGFLYINIKLWWVLHALASQNTWYFFLFFFLVVSWL